MKTKGRISIKARRMKAFEITPILVFSSGLKIPNSIKKPVIEIAIKTILCSILSLNFN